MFKNWFSDVVNDKDEVARYTRIAGLTGSLEQEVMSNDRNLCNSQVMQQPAGFK